jgi:thioredoxin 1
VRLAAAAGLAVFIVSRWGRSLEIGEAEFGAKVLEASTPVLVMFNPTAFYGCADDELRQLRGEWRGRISVVTMNSSASPALAAEYGVEKDPILLLFERGRLVKAANAREMEDRVKARRGGHDAAGMKAELGVFARRS